METAERTTPRKSPTVYDGFISYSHAADDLLAPRLQSGLQRFAKPWWKRRALRIFRDESSLSANPHLWSSITEALDQSGWFVLLLSPDAAQSEWVNQEIEYWKEHKDPSRILPVLTDGTFEWTDGDVSGTAAPEQLQGTFSEEPRWVDMRFARDETDLDLKDPRFADAIADIASALRGIPKDELASEDVRQHRRTIRTAWAAGALVLLLGIAAVFAAVQASQNAEEARQLAEAQAAARAEAQANAEEAETQRDRAEAETERAELNAQEAERQSRLAKARELAASAINVVDEDPQLALLLALEAINATPSAVEQPAEIIDALWTAGTRHRLVDVLDPEAGGFANIDVTSDGSLLAVANISSATLQLYDTETLQPIWEHQEHTSDDLTEVRFSPDGSRISLSIMDSESFGTIGIDPSPFPELADVADGDELPGRIHIFDVETGTLEHSLSFPDCGAITLGEWSPDGMHFVVTSAPPAAGERCVRDGSPGGQWAEVFETSNWDTLALIDTPMEEDFFDGPIPRFDNSGQLYIFGWADGPRIYSADDYTLISDLDEPRGAVAVTPDGTLFGAVGFGDAGWPHTLADTESGATVDRLSNVDARPNLPNGLNFSSDGSFLFSITNGSDIYVWDVSSGDLAHRLLGRDGSRGVYDPSTGLLYSGHADGLVRIWNLGQPTFGRSPAGDLGTASWVNGSPFAIGTDLGMFEAIDFEAGEGYVMFFDLNTGELTGQRKVGNDQLALPDGRFMYSRDHVEYVIYDPETGSEMKVLGCQTEDFETCVDTGEPWIPYRNDRLSIDGDEISVVSLEDEDQTSFELTFIDLADTSITSTKQYEGGFLEVYGFSDDWVFYDDGSEGLAIDRTTGEVLWKSGLRISRFNESPSRSLYSVLHFNTVHIIEPGTWESRPLPFEFGEVRGMAFSQDETLLALGDERHLSIVDLTTDEIVQRVPIEGVSDAYWLDDENVVVGTKHGVWAVVSLNTERLIEDAGESILRGFTEQECKTYRIDPCPTLDEIRDR